MVIISVDQPLSLARDGKSPVCFFRREIVQNESLSIELEKIISVLHVLFLSVPHEIHIKYVF